MFTLIKNTMLFLLIVMLFSCEKKKSAETIKYPVITQKKINAKKNTYKENEYSESKKIPPQQIGNYTRTYKNADLKKIASSVLSVQRLFEFNQKWLSNGYPYCIMNIDNQDKIIQDALNSNLTIDDLINWSDLVARCGNTEASISFLEKLLELCETESQENQIKSLLAIAYLITSDPSQSEDQITIKQDTVKNLNYAVELGLSVANATQNPKNSKTIILKVLIRIIIVPILSTKVLYLCFHFINCFFCNLFNWKLLATTRRRNMAASTH